tara:strand:+ start:4513 stop:6201 length:1689 start_codon:yes stop_codon:yes gene_type:complete
MPSRPFRLLLVSLVLHSIAHLGPVPQADASQRGAALEWFEIPGRPGIYHRIQRAKDDSLVLTPNECFFPKLGLTAAGTGSTPDQENLNGGKSFEHITGWDPGDIVEWGIWIDTPGRATIRVGMSSTGANGSFSLRIGDQSKSFSILRSVTAFDMPLKKGKNIVRLVCNQKPSAGAKLHRVDISGPAIRNGTVLRKRWRPSAAHARFSSSMLTADARMWIMEMDAVPGELGFYAPVTTPFGYYGPLWNADGTVQSSMNFSLWSYGRNQKEPPIKELSHLLAIGNRDAAFSGFGHEGTGVKIRNWEPLAGRQGQRQAFALRVEPGKDFNTYYSYFYATDEQAWKLFGVGRQKPKRRALTHLTLGSFVEVPGPPQRQRTGSTIRRMRYRGWISKDGSDWNRLDTMGRADIDKKTGITYTDRGLDSDGWFFMQTGGWEYRKGPDSDFTLQADQESTPAYLRPDKVRALLDLPSTILVTGAKREGSLVSLSYRISGSAANAKVTAFFGEHDCLTLAKRWAGNQRIVSTGEGNNSTVLNVGSTSPVYLRLLLQHDGGQYWSWETTQIP